MQSQCSGQRHHPPVFDGECGEEMLGAAVNEPTSPNASFADSETVAGTSSQNFPDRATIALSKATPFNEATTGKPRRPGRRVCAANDQVAPGSKGTCTAFSLWPLRSSAWKRLVSMGLWALTPKSTRRARRLDFAGNTAGDWQRTARHDAPEADLPERADRSLIVRCHPVRNLQHRNSTPALMPMGAFGILGPAASLSVSSGCRSRRRNHQSPVGILFVCRAVSFPQGGDQCRWARNGQPHVGFGTDRDRSARRAKLPG